jgi:hypothetical protein
MVTSENFDSFVAQIVDNLPNDRPDALRQANAIVVQLLRLLEMPTTADSLEVLYSEEN